MEKILFTTQNYSHFLSQISEQDIPHGKLEIKLFPDGELYHRIENDVTNKSAVIIAGTSSDTETLELFDLAYGLVKLGVNSLTLVVPFMGYSTMERAVKQGEIVKAKTRATILSAIPQAPNGNKILLFDLHSEGIPHYFNEQVRTVHIYCKKIVMSAALEIYGTDFVLASTDAGRAKWVESLANDMGINAAFVFKRRVNETETQVTSISADVNGKNVVIYDDMIRTGGSLLNAAKSYKEAGAREISVITTHGLFNNNAVEKIKQSGLIKHLICTDTHPNAIQLQNDFLQVKSIANLILENL